MKIRAYLKLALIAAIAALAVGCGDTKDDNVVPPSSNPVVIPASVYTMTNNATTNAIREFRRNDNGTLTFVADYSTDGRGSADSLTESSNSIFFNRGTNRIYAVNAGSNTISAMTVNPDGSLTLLSTAPSGGIRPISVTEHGDVAYVLNAGSSADNQAANIAGFRLIDSTLTAIPGAVRSLSADHPNPAQIQFAPSGTVLAVTERDTNKITTFTVNSAGLAGDPQVHASSGNTPFGFDFTPGGVLIVSEANFAPSGPVVAGSSVASYSVGVSGVVTTLTSSVANGQSQACWVEVSRQAPYAYVSNAGSNNLSIYSIDASGVIGLLHNGNSAATGARPTEMSISTNGQFLYVLNTGDDSISAYSINEDGSLTGVNGIAGLPANAVGLIAR